MNALAALLVLVIYVHKAEQSRERLEPRPELFGREHEPGYILRQDGYTVPDFPGPWSVGV
jgi:hypothetical protein